MRAFVAISVDDPAVLEAIAAMQARLELGRAVPPQNLHFTLAFLGEITGERAAEAAASLARVRFKPFRIQIRGMGAFPSAGRARVVWTGTDEGGEQAMAELAGRVRQALGMPAERFRAHLTVFRVKSGAGNVAAGLAQYGDAVFGSFTAGAPRLMRSVLSPDGPTYSDAGVAGSG